MIPEYKDIMFPLLESIKEGKSLKILEIEEWLTRYFNLTDEEKKALIPGKNLGMFNHRVYWAILELKKLNYIEFADGGRIKISPRGQKTLEANNAKNNLLLK